MNRVLTFSLSLLVAGSCRAESCSRWYDFFLPKPKTGIELEREVRHRALKLVDEISSLEKEIKRLQEFNGQAQRRTETESHNRRKIFADIIRANSTRSKNHAMDVYRNYFRDVLLSYSIRVYERNYIKQIEDEVKAGKRNPWAARKDINESRKKIKEAGVTFAAAFREYMSALEEIDTLIAANANYSRLAKEVELSLNLRGLSRNFPQLELSAYIEPSLVKEEFRTSPDILIALLKRDRSIEIRLRNRLLLLNYTTLNMWDRFFSKVAPEVWPQMKGILNIATDINQRETHLSNVEKVLEAAPEDQLEELRDQNSRTEDDTFLIVFAGVTKASKPWENLKNQAKQLGETNSIYKRFHKRMLDAEEKAARVHDISLYTQQSGAQRTSVVAAGISATVLSVTTANWSTISNWFQTTVTLENTQWLLNSVVEFAKSIAQ